MAFLAAGPEIRVQILTAERLWLWCQSGLALWSSGGGPASRVTQLASPCEVRARADGIEVAGRIYLAAVRVAPRAAGDGPSSSAETGRADRVGDGLPAGDNVALADGRPTGAVGVGDSPLIAVSTRPDGARAARFRGLIELRPHAVGIQAINALPLEAYLAGVVGREIPALYPLDALKAQAVASRSFVLHALRRGGRPAGEGPAGSGKVFSSGTMFQVYGGVAAEHPRVHRALRETQGEVLLYNGQLFSAYFHSTCGGQTARASLVFGEPAIPPLSGTRCGACEGSRYFRWESEASAKTLEEAIRRRVEKTSFSGREGDPGRIDMGRLLSLSVAETGPDGRVLYVLVEHDRGSFEWRADRFRFEVERVAPDTVRSTAFGVERLERGEVYRFRGSGWGHGVGLCQVGSGRLAETLDYRGILDRYYPASSVAAAY